MNRVDQLRQRVLAARARLDRVPATGPGELGAPDPASGERWHRGNVLGHLAEMIGFWTEQARAALGGARAVGRGETGTRERQEGVERGSILPEAELRAEIALGLDRLDALLSEVTAGDLEKSIVYRRRGGESETTVGEFIESILVRHLEEHLDQLEELT
jgi:hypothetical protein